MNPLSCFFTSAVTPKPTIFGDPTNWKEIMSNPDKDSWKKAVYAEHGVLKERQVFRIVSSRAVLAAGIKPIGSRLVLNTKYDEHGNRIKDCLLYTSPSPRD